MTFTSLFKNHRAFFILFIFWLILGCWYLLSFPKGEGFILLNPIHSSLLDQFFIYFTWLGDGLFALVVAFIFIFMKRKRLGMLIIFSFLFSGLIAQIIKLIVIAPRPAVFFQFSDYPHFITDVTLFNYHSFPSGHTTSIFALMVTLIFSLKNTFAQIALFLLAVAAGYSRIYLGQHFPEDVLTGSVIGLFAAIMGELYLRNYVPKRKYLIGKRLEKST